MLPLHHITSRCGLVQPDSHVLIAPSRALADAVLFAHEWCGPKDREEKRANELLSLSPSPPLSPVPP